MMTLQDDKKELTSDPEEGEIRDEYEFIISSEEECSMRQRIKELEATNDELEKIAKISGTFANEYNYSVKGVSTSCTAVPNSCGSYNVARYKNITNASQIPSDVSSISSVELQFPSPKKRKRHKNKGNRGRTTDHSRANYRKHDSYRANCSRVHAKKLHKNVRSTISHRSRSYRELDIISLGSSDSSEENVDQESCGEKNSGVLFLNRDELRFALARTTKENKIGDLKERLEIERYEETAKKVAIEGQQIVPEETAINPKDTIESSDSLEEQELRLIALKSAILKKHIARKKRNAEVAYSPTDFDDILAGTDDNMDIVDFDDMPAGMEVSPEASPKLSLSPNRLDEEELSSSNISVDNVIDVGAVDIKPVDMDIANSESDNDDNMAAESNNWKIAPQIPLPMSNILIPEINIPLTYDPLNYAAQMPYGIYIPEMQFDLPPPPPPPLEKLPPPPPYRFTLKPEDACISEDYSDHSMECSSYNEQETLSIDQKTEMQTNCNNKITNDHILDSAGQYQNGVENGEDSDEEEEKALRALLLSQFQPPKSSKIVNAPLEKQKTLLPQSDQPYTQQSENAGTFSTDTSVQQEPVNPTELILKEAVRRLQIKTHSERLLDLDTEEARRKETDVIYKSNYSPLQNHSHDNVYQSSISDNKEICYALDGKEKDNIIQKKVKCVKRVHYKENNKNSSPKRNMISIDERNVNEAPVEHRAKTMKILDENQEPQFNIMKDLCTRTEDEITEHKASRIGTLEDEQDIEIADTIVASDIDTVDKVLGGATNQEDDQELPSDIDTDIQVGDKVLSDTNQEDVDQESPLSDMQIVSNEMFSNVLASENTENIIKSNLEPNISDAKEQECDTCDLSKKSITNSSTINVNGEGENKVQEQTAECTSVELSEKRIRLQNLENLLRNKLIQKQKLPANNKNTIKIKPTVPLVNGSSSSNSTASPKGVAQQSIPTKAELAFSSSTYTKASFISKKIVKPNKIINTINIMQRQVAEETPSHTKLVRVTENQGNLASSITKPFKRPTKTKTLNSAAQQNNSRLVTAADLSKIPVRKFVISLRASETETSEDEEFFSNDNKTNHALSQSWLLDEGRTESSELLMRTINNNYYDNTSPISLPMDSPCMTPVRANSPVTFAETTNDNGLMTKALVNDLFEQKLNNFLKDVRTKVQQKNVDAKVAINIEKTDNQSQYVTPVAVRHLPAASQQEYKRLIHRMNMLEKQKNAKCNAAENVNNGTLQLQPMKVASIHQVSVPPTSVQPTATKNNLIKKVLIKNAANNNADITSTLCDTQKRVVKMKHHEPSKTNVLRAYESSFLKVGTGIVTTLDKSLNLVEEAKKAKMAKLSHEQRLKELRLEIEEVQRKFKQEQQKITKIYPEICSANEVLTSLKQKRTKLFKAATNLGRNIKGDDYRLDNEVKHEISVKTKKLATEIKCVNSMKYNDIDKYKKEDVFINKNSMASMKISTCSSTDNTAAIATSNEKNGYDLSISNESPSKVSRTAENKNQEMESIINSKVQTVTFSQKEDSELDLDNIGPKTIESDSIRVSSIEDNAKEVIVIDNGRPATNYLSGSGSSSSNSNDENTMAEDINLRAAAADQKAEPVNEDVKEGSRLCEYVSPLSHLREYRSELDPSGILCPYELMGQCEDDDCSYTHFSEKKIIGFVGAANSCNEKC